MVEADEKMIRRYLLGELAEAEMVPFEDRLMTDDRLFEMLQVVEDELLDEAAAGELSADEHARFDSYFLATDERRNRLEMALTLHDYARRRAALPKVFPAPVRRTGSLRWLSSRPYLSLAVAAMMLIAIGLIPWQVLFTPSDLSKGLQALNKAYREQRPTEARITGFDYAPYRAARGNEAGKVDAIERELAASLLLGAANEASNVHAYHAAGRFYLAQHNFDEAIKYFEQALQVNANQAQLESDLGAAYLERGKIGGRENQAKSSREDFARSLEHLDRSLRLDDSLLQARFNRALLYESMNRAQEAREEWLRYLDRDSDSPWAKEASRRLQTLAE